VFDENEAVVEIVFQSKSIAKQVCMFDENEAVVESVFQSISRLPNRFACLIRMRQWLKVCFIVSRVVKRVANLLSKCLPVVLGC
jgi:hypothetical protein